MKFAKSLIGMACVLSVSLGVHAQSTPSVGITSTKDLKSNNEFYDSANVQCFSSLDELRALPNGYLVSGQGEGGLTTMTLNGVKSYIIALAPTSQSGALLTPTGSRYELTNSRGVVIQNDGSVTLLDFTKYSGCEAARVAGESGLGAGGALASGGASGAAAGGAAGLSTSSTLAIGAGAVAVIAIIADDDDDDNPQSPATPIVPETPPVTPQEPTMPTTPGEPAAASPS